MDKASDKRRFWSDGHGIYHIATFGERVFAGIAEWAIVIILGLVLSVIVSTIYGYVFQGDPYAYYVYGDTEDDRILLVVPLTVVFATIIQIASAIMVGRFGVSFGYHVMTLAVKRQDADRLGWRRCLVRKMIGSPLLSIPYLALVLQGLLFVCWGFSGTLLGESNELVVLLRSALTGYWPSATVLVLIAIAVLVLTNHGWMRIDPDWRSVSDVLVDTVVVQNRILSTNRAAFPSTGRKPVERWD